MKEFLQIIFKTSEERIKNPIIGSFLTSFIVFNWKPILFLIFAQKTIEFKISYIENNYSNISNFFWFPLISTFVYLIILPYLSLGIEKILHVYQKKSENLLNNKKKSAIEFQKEIAIEEIKLEEAKTEFRERKTHNELIKELQNKIEALENEKLAEHVKFTEHIETLKTEMNKREDSYKEIILNLEKKYTETINQISSLKKKVRIKSSELLDFDINEETNKLNKTVKEFILSDGSIIEYKKSNNDFYYYYDKDNNSIMTDDEFNNLVNNSEYFIENIIEK